MTYGTAAMPLTIIPANEAACDDLQTVFGTRGSAVICQCQRYKLRPREAFAKFPVAERAARLRVQTACGDARSATTSGLVAYLDREPVGWCAVEPRPAFTGLVRNNRVPWEGRTEDKADGGVWAITCVFVRAGFRGRGIGYALVGAAVDFARARGARAVEGYPIIAQHGQQITWDEIHVGTRSMFAAAGLTEVSHPTIRRLVMRIDFSPRGTDRAVVYARSMPRGRVARLVAAAGRPAVAASPLGGTMPGPTTVDEYFAGLPDEARSGMDEIRQAVRAGAPNATEVITYKMPGLKSHGGRFLISYDAYKRHYSLFPASEAVIAELGDALTPHLSGSGTIRFPKGEPLPLAMITRIVEIRYAENAATAARAARAADLG